jgi:hypothetical protein
VREYTAPADRRTRLTGICSKAQSVDCSVYDGVPERKMLSAWRVTVLRKKPDEVPNEGLTAWVVPSVTASWHAIVGFAHTIDGYKAIGRKECAELANRAKAEFLKDAVSIQTLSLKELRFCLFFEQRRFNHFGHEPVGADRIFINALLEAIQKKI